MWPGTQGLIDNCSTGVDDRETQIVEPGWAVVAQDGRLACVA